MASTEDWLWTSDRYLPEKEGIREVLCAMGNGNFVTRAAAPESSANQIHYPGTYLAGVYNRATSLLNGKIYENEDLVNMPNWLYLTFRIEEGNWFSLDEVLLLSYEQQLDLRQGVVTRTFKFEDKEGRVTSYQNRCFAHMKDAHLAGLEIVITPENWSGRIEIKSGLEGRIVNDNVRRFEGLNKKHIEPISMKQINPNTIFLKVRTLASRIEVAEVSRTTIFIGGERFYGQTQTFSESGYIEQTFQCDVIQGQTIEIEKIVSIFASRDHAMTECGHAAIQEIEYAPDFKTLLKTQEQEWSILWEHFDIQLELKDPVCSMRSALSLRLHIFHLLQTVSIHSIDLDVGLPARGWHGEGYRGHIFWDDLFVFPFYILRIPTITRSLLLYRYRRLNEARRLASLAGYKGAMFPWQSASNGQEETPELYKNKITGEWQQDFSHLQRHVNAAIVCNLWRYYQCTEDIEFLNFYGAELIYEIARFWASIATYNPVINRYEIKGVVGPDEFHTHYPGANKPGINNNAYTNVMAAWVLRFALKLKSILPHHRYYDLVKKLNLRTDEFDEWNKISRQMKICFFGNGIISQFDGYETLKELDWASYRQKYTDLQNMDFILQAEGDSVNHYQVSKQADVLMLFYLFSYSELKDIFERLDYPCEEEMIPKTIQYYISRTTDGSTLSRIADSWVLARQNRSQSWALFEQAMDSDIEDIHGGSTQEGIHLGAMGGTIDLIQRCFPGLRLFRDIIWVQPELPDEMKSLKFRLRYRGHTLQINITQNHFVVSAGESFSKPIRVGFDLDLYTLSAGETLHFRLPAKSMSYI